jgi:hypothetical protein
MSSNTTRIGTPIRIAWSSPAYARFVQELAYYEADKSYLTTEKCAQRCWLLSALLTAAATDAGYLRASRATLIAYAQDRHHHPPHRTACATSRDPT